MRLPSRTVRIERAALEEVYRVLQPEVVNERCICCRGAILKCSPPMLSHFAGCADARRFSHVYSLISKGISAASIPAKKRKAKRKK